MAHILIDGYNLIGTAHRNLEKARGDIIEKLSEYAKLKSHNITLVFDGWKEGRATETHQRISSIDVIYSRLGENADSVIKKILSRDKKPWIVVSSDREIADFADKKGSIPITTQDFESKLQSITHYDAESLRGEVPEKDDEDDYAVPAKQKGNPHKLSKKQKQKLAALKKL